MELQMFYFQKEIVCPFLFPYIIVCRSLFTCLFGVAVSSTDHVTIEFWLYVRVNKLLS